MKWIALFLMAFLILDFMYTFVFWIWRRRIKCGPIPARKYLTATCICAAEVAGFSWLLSIVR